MSNTTAQAPAASRTPSSPCSNNPAKKTDRPTFTILNSDVPFTFCHIGGYIYISRKLLELLPQDDDHSMEFSIAHEMAHLNMHHMLQCLRSPGVKAVKIGIIATVYLIILPLAYPDEMEFAADSWAYNQMRGLGRSEFECLSFLRKLDSYARSHELKGGRGKLGDLVREAEAEGTSVSVVENHLRAHTSAHERLRHLRETIEEKNRTPK